MKTLDQDLTEIRQRLAALGPGSSRHWGRMTAREVVCHLDDAFRLCMGEKRGHDVSNIFTRTVMKFFALQVPLKWPHGIQAGPEVVQGQGGTPPQEFAEDMGRLMTSVERFLNVDFTGKRHPMFGEMSRQEWMRWGYLHTDHHLRQFGH